MSKTIKESLTLSDYEITLTKQSEIDKDKTITIFTGIECPHCKTKITYTNSQKHKMNIGNFSITCSNCHIYMEYFGNSLECTLKNK